MASSTPTAEEAFLKAALDQQDELAAHVATQWSIPASAELMMMLHFSIQDQLLHKLLEAYGIDSGPPFEAFPTAWIDAPETWLDKDSVVRVGHSRRELHAFTRDAIRRWLESDAVSPLFYDATPNILGRFYEAHLATMAARSTVGRYDISKDLKRARGVFYTPECVTDYIVRNALSNALQFQTPLDLAAAPLTILDPACGGGVFLQKAFEVLLDWHLRWYVQHDSDRWTRPHDARIIQCKSPVAATGKDASTERRDVGWYRGYRLTAAEATRILTTCVHGVDRDSHAVAVTRGTLWLTLARQARDIEIDTHSTARFQLPDLTSNVQHGDALTGPGEWAERPMSGDLNHASCEAVALNWSEAFPIVREAGGFDVIVGNPPYRRERDYKTRMDEIACGPLGAKYRMPRMDLWYYFAHRALELLKPRGILSFIVSAYWMSSTGARKLRAAFCNETHIDELFLLGKRRVFQGVAGEHVIFRVSKTVSDAPTVIKQAANKTDRVTDLLAGRTAPYVFEKQQDQLFRFEHIDCQPSPSRLLEQLNLCPSLQTLGDVRQGIAENPARITRRMLARVPGEWELGQGVFALTNEELKALDLPEAERGLLRPYHALAGLGRYHAAVDPGLNLIYSTRNTCPDIDVYPTIRHHLERFRPIMEARRETRKQINRWWHLHWPRDERIWKSPKLVCVQMAPRPSFVPVAFPLYSSFSTNVFVPGPVAAEHRLEYFAAILNSRLLWKWFQHHAKRRGVGLEINGHVLRRAPIRPIDFGDVHQRGIHDRLTELVHNRLDVEQHRRSRLEATAEAPMQRRIDAIEREIDVLVCDLYNVRFDEIVDSERDVLLPNP